MGRHLDAHIQRYLDSGDFPAFWLGFDDALREDALAKRPPASYWGIHDENGVPHILAEKKQPPLTPEELLAALEPPKPAPTLTLSPAQQLRGSLNVLEDWMLFHIHPAVIALAFVSILVLIAWLIALVLAPILR